MFIRPITKKNRHCRIKLIFFIQKPTQRTSYYHADPNQYFITIREKRFGTLMRPTPYTVGSLFIPFFHALSRNTNKNTPKTY